MTRAPKRMEPRDRLHRAQLRRWLVADIYLDGKLLKFVTAVNPKRRLVTVATQSAEGRVYLNERGDAMHRTQLVGDIRIEWRSIKP